MAPPVIVVSRCKIDLNVGWLTNGNHLHVSVLERTLELILLTSLNLILGRVALNLGNALLGIECLGNFHLLRGKEGEKREKVSKKTND